MIIPVRCFSCGKVLADKYTTYQKKVLDKKRKKGLDENETSIIDFNSEDLQKTPEGEALDELGLIRYCCRKILLTHIDLIYEVN